MERSIDRAIGKFSLNILIIENCEAIRETFSLLGRLHLNDPVPMGDEPSPALISLPIQPPPRLLAVTVNGRVALVRWEFAGQQQGTLERFLPTALEGDEVVSLLPLPNPEDRNANETKSLGLLTSDGRFKRLPLKDIQELSGRAATVLKLKEGVSLKAALICQDGADVAVISQNKSFLVQC